ncbi:putative low-complexity protein [Chryseobacterium sp. H1D6B]|uniref:HvfA family oxazolone/thioamide-modified RiPP metallophore n=1 Tax=Chryseobacterium sp. H1D6B TaxID=2940588 RepID=UPI0015C87C82|nr:hypothetical protein [Chryseobacterium sp. H1D6B]MDH6253820.1 putative low-complexity protein [Chryseobacterium sp. H1D6B]
MKNSILVGALALSAFAAGTNPTFASIRTTNAVSVEAACGDKKADAKADGKAKEASCGDKKAEMKAKEGKCGEGKCGGKKQKKEQKKAAKKAQKEAK